MSALGGEPAPDQVAAVPTISGACFCMRREDFDCLQGFDEKYFLHVEDVDLCCACADGGRCCSSKRGDHIGTPA